MRRIKLGAVDCRDARLAMRAIRLDRHLPPGPGPRLDAEILQGDGEQARGDLLARRDERVVFPRVVQRRQALAPGDQLVGDAGHGGDHDGDLMPGLDLALDPAGDVADTVEIGDGGAAELHDDAGHKSFQDVRPCQFA